MSNTFFSIDGSYGSATNILVVDTSSWTEADWTLIEEASDSERLEVAHNLTFKE